MPLGLKLGLSLSSHRPPSGEGGGGVPEWIIEGALIDLDFENDRYFMGTERPLSEIASGTVYTFSGGLDCRYNSSAGRSRLVATAAALTVLEAQFHNGLTSILDFTDDGGDGAVPGEYLGFYNIADPGDSDDGNAVELWSNSSQRIDIDDWVNDYESTNNTVQIGQRNLAAWTINVPVGGGDFKNAVCLNGDAVASVTQAIEMFSGTPILTATFGWINGGGPADGRCVINRLTITTPKADAALPALTVVPESDDVTGPTITSAANITRDEGAALDHKLTANELVTWQVTGGADVAAFTLNAGSNTVDWPAFLIDFEAPADADANNVYEFSVRATDAYGNTTDQNITVTVLDVAE